MIFEVLNAILERLFCVGGGGVVDDGESVGSGVVAERGGIRINAGLRLEFGLARVGIAGGDEVGHWRFDDLSIDSVIFGHASEVDKVGGGS